MVLMQDVMEGFNGTLFCYGQTGSGKTYSEYDALKRSGEDCANPSYDGQSCPRLVGGRVSNNQGADIENPSLKGLIPRIVEQIFASIMSADVTIEYTVKVSYMEIYMERIKDLLAREFPSSGLST